MKFTIIFSLVFINLQFSSGYKTSDYSISVGKQSNKINELPYQKFMLNKTMSQFGELAESIISKIIKKLKDPEIPRMRNICVWKICSKPSKVLKKVKNVKKSIFYEGKI